MGIFPYVLKLLQSSARELRPLLVFIWAKILAVDSVSSLLPHHGGSHTLPVGPEPLVSYRTEKTLPQHLLLVTKLCPGLCQLPDDHSVFCVSPDSV